jgi:hypothetical protein
MPVPVGKLLGVGYTEPVHGKATKQTWCIEKRLTCRCKRHCWQLDPGQLYCWKSNAIKIAMELSGFMAVAKQNNVYKTMRVLYGF